jgi:hypothetical protein
MAKKYFRYVPNFDYVNRTSEGQNISDYTLVKNLFKRVKLREDIFSDLTFFEKYKVIGDDRPDNVAFEVYGDANLDWVVLLSNNIVNYETEWPMDQQSFDNYLTNKYGSVEEINATRFFETNEVVDSRNNIIVPRGFEVPEDYTVSFFDVGLNQMVTRSSVSSVSNLEFEERRENDKRNIFLLKPFYLNVVLDDVEALLPYTPGSSQYVSESVVRGENIRLYQ